MKPNDLPLISIVTPSYNQGKYLEKTILSVINQNYPNLEYIVMDGGSTDNSVDIIKKYEGHIAYWVSEKDNGQSDAIAKGFKIANGDILAYLNSDDVFFQGALRTAANVFYKGQDTDWIIGKHVHIDPSDITFYRPLISCPDFTQLIAYTASGFSQAATFWRKDLYTRVGGLNKDLNFCMDYDLFVKFAHEQKPIFVNKYFAAVRNHNLSKTSTMQDVMWNEVALIHNLYSQERSNLSNIQMVYYCKILPLLRLNLASRIYNRFVKLFMHSQSNWEPWW